MKTKICVLCLASAAVGFVLSGIQQSRTTAQEKADSGRAKWEYDFLISPNAERLNELGNEGWELVAATSKGNGDLSATCYFKRAILP
jgi:hypothetical protein